MLLQLLLRALLQLKMRSRASLPPRCVPQCVAVRCSVLQSVAACCSVFCSVAVCCNMLQYVAVCCSILQCLRVVVCCKYGAVCCSVLQCVAVSFSVLQCVAVCCSHANRTWPRVVCGGTLSKCVQWETIYTWHHITSHMWEQQSFCAGEHVLTH